MQLLQLQKERLNKFNDLLPVGLLAQLQKPSTGIAEVKGSNSVQAWIFFQAFFSHCKSCVCNCDDPLSYYAPINVNPVAGECGQGVGIWCLRLSPLSGFWSCEATPGSGHLTWANRRLVLIPGINSEAVTRSVPRGFLKVTPLEKGMKFSFVLIAIIWYFKLSFKQIMSILRKFLSSSSHLIVNLDWNRIPPWKSEDFLRVTDPTCSDMYLTRCYKAFYVSLIL